MMLFNPLIIFQPEGHGERYKTSIFFFVEKSIFLTLTYLEKTISKIQILHCFNWKNHKPKQKNKQTNKKTYKQKDNVIILKVKTQSECKTLSSLYKQYCQIIWLLRYKSLLIKFVTFRRYITLSCLNLTSFMLSRFVWRVLSQNNINEFDYINT